MVCVCAVCILFSIVLCIHFQIKYRNEIPTHPSIRKQFNVEWIVKLIHVLMFIVCDISVWQAQCMPLYWINQTFVKGDIMWICKYQMYGIVCRCGYIRFEPLSFGYSVAALNHIQYLSIKYNGNWIANRFYIISELWLVNESNSHWTTGENVYAYAIICQRNILGKRLGNLSPNLRFEPTKSIVLFFPLFLLS